MASLAMVFRGSLFLMSPAAGAAAGPKAAGAAAGVNAAAKKGEKMNAIMKPLPVSEELLGFAGGAPEVARAQALKLVWAHIKAHGLQDPVNRTEINCEYGKGTLLSSEHTYLALKIAVWEGEK